MTTEPVSTSQVGLIRTLASKAGMDDDTYRLFLAPWTHGSTKSLTREQASQVIDRLKDMNRQASPARGAVAGLTTPVAKKLQALWIAGWNLGLVRDRTDRAMLSFLERQTGVSHTRFLAHPSEATAAIEALKDWLARDGGIEWPVQLRGNDVDVWRQKLAVIDAQFRRLVEAGGAKAREDLFHVVFKVTGTSDVNALSSRQLDDMQKSLGRQLRDALARDHHSSARKETCHGI